MRSKKINKNNNTANTSKFHFVIFPVMSAKFSFGLWVLSAFSLLIMTEFLPYQ